MSAGRGDRANSRDQQKLNDGRVREVWALIPGARKASKSNWFGSGTALLIEFKNGVCASLSPTESGRLFYTDNTTMDWRWGITLQSDSLYAIVRELVRTAVEEGR